jgi:hypothetical protein
MSVSVVVSNFPRLIVVNAYPTIGATLSRS